MTALIEWLAGGAWQIVAPLLLLVFGSFAAYAKGRSDGKAKRKMQEMEADHENAEHLRRNVDRNLDQRVREMDGRGYRD